MKVQGKGIRASMPFFSRQTEFTKCESDFTNREPGPVGVQLFPIQCPFLGENRMVFRG